MKRQAFLGRFVLALVLVIGLSRPFHAVPVPTGGSTVVIRPQGSTSQRGPVVKQVVSGGEAAASPSPTSVAAAPSSATAQGAAPASATPSSNTVTSPSTSPASSPATSPYSNPSAAPAANTGASSGAPPTTMSGYVSTLDPAKYPRCGNSSPDSSPLVALSKADMSKYACGQCIYVCYQGQPTVCAKYQVQYTCTDCFPGNILVNRYPQGTGEGSLVTIQSGRC